MAIRCYSSECLHSLPNSWPFLCSGKGIVGSIISGVISGNKRFNCGTITTNIPDNRPITGEDGMCYCYGGEDNIMSIKHFIKHHKPLLKLCRWASFPQLKQIQKN